MFPNFKSLAQREQKRHEMLEKAERRKRQAAVKREMYEGAIWASDADNTLAGVTKTTGSQATEADIAAATADPNARILIDNETKKKTSGSNEGTIPVMVDPPTNTNVEPPVAQPAPSPVEPVVEPVVQSAEDVRSSILADNENSREWVEQWYEINPKWVSYKLNPIKINGSRHGKYYIGDEGKLYNVKTNKVGRSKVIDWVSTKYFIGEMYEDGTDKQVVESREMGLNDFDINVGPSNKKKRIGDYLEKPVYDEDYDDSEIPATGTSMENDESMSKSKLLWLMRELSYAKAKAAKEGRKSDIERYTFTLHPVLKDGFDYPDRRSSNTYDVYLNELDDKYSIFIRSLRGLKPKAPAVERNVSWTGIMKELLKLFGSRNIDIYELMRSPELVANPKNFVSGDGERKKGVKSGLSSEVRNMSIPDKDAKKFIVDYFAELRKKDLPIPFKLHPITGNEVKRNYFFGQASDRGGIVIRNQNNKGYSLSGKTFADLLKKINWVDTLNVFISGMEEVGRLHDSDDIKDSDRKRLAQYIEIFNKVVKENSYYPDLRTGVKYEGKGLNSESSQGSQTGLKTRRSRSSGKDPSIIDRTLRAFSSERQLNNRLKGRGLRGAGQYQNLERRGKYYNLNDIRGTGLASAYIYQPIGSKYIRIPDLDKGELNIVYPSRKKLGPKR